MPSPHIAVRQTSQSAVNKINKILRKNNTENLWLFLGESEKHFGRRMTQCTLNFFYFECRYIKKYFVYNLSLVDKCGQIINNWIDNIFQNVHKLYPHLCFRIFSLLIMNSTQIRVKLPFPSSIIYYLVIFVTSS